MYAILIGREKKVVDTWAECQELTRGFPRNKFQKVDSEEEGLRLINEFNSKSVERTGFEDRKYHVYSSLTKNKKVPNVTITIRASQQLKGYGHFKTPTTTVVCIIQSPKELSLPQAREVLTWDKRPRYIYEVSLQGLQSDKQTAIYKVLQEVFSLLRLYYDDLSILLNTESNLLLHSLSKNLFRNLEIVNTTDILYQEELMGLYLQLSSFDGLVLNYEAGDRVSTEGHYMNLYLKGEYDIYAD